MTAYCIGTLVPDTNPTCTNLDAMASYLRRIRAATDDATIKAHCTNALAHYYLITEQGEIGSYDTPA